MPMAGGLATEKAREMAGATVVRWGCGSGSGWDAALEVRWAEGLGAPSEEALELMLELMLAAMTMRLQNTPKSLRTHVHNQKYKHCTRNQIR